MDEVDSLLSQRSDSEHESSRRIKNEFFIQLDGAVTNEDDHVVVIGATNRPQELDEAVRRRFVRRIYVSLPVAKARQLIIQKLIQQIHHNLSDAQIEELAKLTEGYSGADMDSLCRYAAMQPLRALTTAQIDVIDAQQVSKSSASSSSFQYPALNRNSKCKVYSFPYVVYWGMSLFICLWLSVFIKHYVTGDSKFTASIPRL